MYQDLCSSAHATDHSATRCNMLHHRKIIMHTATHSATLCNMLQHIVTLCNTRT